jgi:SAM-dependent methyltransferase
MQGLINWELLTELMLPPMTFRPGMWDEAAKRYDGFSKLESDYTKLQIEAMQLTPTDTCLDIGCGSGRISVPVAAKVKSVTALDGSAPMLECVQQNAKSAGRDNITCAHLRWEQVVIGANVQPHDIVILSRTEAMRDLAKVNEIARKYVYIFLFCGPTLKHFSDELLDGVREDGPRPPRKPFMPGHVILFNRLSSMGIDANVEYLPDGFTKLYASREDAYQDLQWLDVPEDKQERFRKNVDRFLIPEKSGFRLLRETKTAVLWWKK